MITIENLTFSFQKNGVPFFENASLDFKPKALNFISGKNGIGKSTLLRILQGDIRATESIAGSLFIDNQRYDFSATHIFIASVAQNFNAMLVDTCSFSENLQFALMPQYPGLFRLPNRKPIPSFVERYGIRYDVPIASLSGGQRQILAILMALQKAPKILLLDEPSAALDEENADLIMNFLSELCAREDITIVLIVHNKEIIKKYSGGFYFEIRKDSGDTRIIVPRIT